jgi:hypothetical protein
MSIGQWPPLCEFRFYDGPPDDHDPWWDGIRRDRNMDLFDALMLHWAGDERTVYVGLSTDSKQWKTWDDKTICKIEKLMRDDLLADGDSAEITRFSGEGGPCDQQIVWKVVVRLSGWAAHHEGDAEIGDSSG